MAGRGLATKVLNQTMKPKEYRPKVNQQQVQNTANNIKNKPTTPTLAPKVNPTTGQRYVDDKTIKKFGLKTAAELNKVKKPKPTTKNLSIPLNASFSPLEEYILETSDAMLKSGYSIDETVDFWTIEDEDLVEKVLSSLTLTESVSFDDDLYVVCERVGALKSLGSWALRQAGKLKGAFSRGGGSTVNVTRSQTRGGIFNTGILKKWFKPICVVCSVCPRLSFLVWQDVLMPTFYTKLDNQQPILWGSMNLVVYAYQIMERATAVGLMTITAWIYQQP